MSDILPGDIILLKQKKRSWIGWVWLTIKQIYTFFIKREGLLDIVSKYYHIEMGYGSGEVVTMEPPRCRTMKTPDVPLKIWRLKNKPTDFNDAFFQYCSTRFGEKFDYKKFFALVLDGMLKTHWFSSKIKDPRQDVCAEFVSRFYLLIKIPCSDVDPDNGIPKDVDNYCSDHLDIFELVRDDPTGG